MIVAGVIVILGILALVFRPRRVVVRPSGGASTEELPGAFVPGAPPSGAGASAAGPVVTAPLPAPAAAARQLALTFAERYGSFSSEGNFVNLTDLPPLMTERFARQIEAQVRRDRAVRKAGAFTATVTAALGVDVDFSGGDAAEQGTARIRTQRTERRADGTTRTSARVLRLALLKTSAGWRVDAAVWE